MPKSQAASSKAKITSSHAAIDKLAKELVQYKIAESESRRRMRVSERAEMVVRESLARRDLRVEELKDTIKTLQRGGSVKKDWTHPRTAMSDFGQKLKVFSTHIMALPPRVQSTHVGSCPLHLWRGHYLF